MITLLQCEYQKTKKCYILLTALGIAAVQMLWGLHGKYDDFMIENGWMAFLYQLPLVNAIFLPILSATVASRLCDIEHKGVMLKQLMVLTKKESFYNAKLIYGLAIVLFCNVLSWAVTIAFGYYKGFGGVLPIKLYLLYLLFTAVPTIAIYMVQHIISLLYKNQTVAFCVCIIGTFIGLFAMFLPQMPFLRRALPWGYYGVMQFVGLFGYTAETKYDYAYFEMMPIDWTYFGVLILMCLAIYIIGLQLFKKKEV